MSGGMLCVWGGEAALAKLRNSTLCAHIKNSFRSTVINAADFLIVPINDFFCTASDEKQSFYTFRKSLFFCKINEPIFFRPNLQIKNRRRCLKRHINFFSKVFSSSQFCKKFCSSKKVLILKKSLWFSFFFWFVTKRSLTQFTWSCDLSMRVRRKESKRESRR